MNTAQLPTKPRPSCTYRRWKIGGKDKIKSSTSPKPRRKLDIKTSLLA